MKALRFILTAAFVTLAISLYAKDGGRKIETTATIALPAFNWGSPEDLDQAAVRQLKFVAFPAPEMTIGNTEELNASDMEALKTTGIRIALPEFTWGAAEDLDDATVEILKNNGVPFPAIVIGDAAEAAAIELK